MPVPLTNRTLTGNMIVLEIASREPSWSVHDTVTQQYPLERSPRIEITGVTGPIVISAGQTGMAEIKSTKKRRTQREVDCFQTKIDRRPDLIAISHVQFTDRPGCESIGARQALTLQVPSDAIFQLSNIYYAEVKIIGPVAGVIAENIGGHVSIEAAGKVNLRNLSNGVSLGLGAASTGSAAIESVFGNVELDLAQRRDVEIRASSIVGEIRSVPSSFVRVKTDEGYLLRSGEGGASVSLKRIDGDIVVKRQ
jgi:hypothetical protein